jgi:ribosomal protein S18 acetylase RimI-like enzyme
MPTDLIQFLEELAANAWPAAVVQVVDGWRLRYTWGITRRTNSVWPNAAGSRWPLEERLVMVEDFYARHNSPARFQICPAAQPADLDDVLARRGYTTDALTAVQTAPAAAVLAAAPPGPFNMSIADTFDAAWFETYRRAEHIDAPAVQARQDILRRIGPRCGYAMLSAAGRPVGIGLGVTEQGWTGIFSMVTAPDFRRQGAATAILRGLAAWSRQHGASNMYLQVMENNIPAQALYASLSFKTVYRYHYREK